MVHIDKVIKHMDKIGSIYKLPKGKTIYQTFYSLEALSNIVAIEVLNIMYFSLS